MTEPPPINSPSQALSLIAEDMRGVDTLIAQRLSTSVALVGDVSQYIIAAGGKRLRPQLLLFVLQLLFPLQLLLPQQLLFPLQLLLAQL